MLTFRNISQICDIFIFHLFPVFRSLTFTHSWPIPLVFQKKTISDRKFQKLFQNFIKIRQKYENNGIIPDKSLFSLSFPHYFPLGKCIFLIPPSSANRYFPRPPGRRILSIFVRFSSISNTFAV